MAQSREYWKQRFEQIEQSQNRQGVQCYADIEKQYRQAQKQLEGQIASWYQRFATNNKITLAEAHKMLSGKELEEFKWDVNQYIQYGEENAINGTWAKQLENASARYHISRLEALKIQTQQAVESMFGNQLDSIDSAMKGIYTDGYYRTAFEIQKGVGVGWDFATLDDKQISKVINKPWAADGKNFSERVWGNRQKLVNEVNTTLTQNIVLGKDPQKAIDEIARKMNTSKNVAGRLVMTEEAAFSSAAQKDCFAELDVEQFEIVATLDSHTSDICQDMDGKHFPMSQWEVGVTAPPFHVYCRSTTVPYFDDEFDNMGERAAKDTDGKTYFVPADTTYKQWEKSFVDGDKSGLKEIKPDDTIKVKDNISEADTQLNDLKQQFSDMTEGYSYDDFMNDFGSIEEGFEGSSLDEIKKAKGISEQIELLMKQQKATTPSVAKDPTEMFKDLGITLVDKSKESVPTETLTKFAEFTTDFEKQHSDYFDRNNLPLNKITIVDDLKVKGQSANGVYHDDSSTIEVKKGSIVSTKPNSKIITFSNSDDYELHSYVHEYGHYIAETLDKSKIAKSSDVLQNSMLRYFDGDIWKTKPQNLKDVIGSYGSTSYGEAFAETFAEAYTCEEPGDFAKIFKEELEKAMKSTVR